MWDESRNDELLWPLQYLANRFRCWWVWTWTSSKRGAFFCDDVGGWSWGSSMTDYPMFNWLGNQKLLRDESIIWVCNVYVMIHAWLLKLLQSSPKSFCESFRNRWNYHFKCFQTKTKEKFHLRWIAKVFFWWRNVEQLEQIYHSRQKRPIRKLKNVTENSDINIQSTFFSRANGRS